MAKRSRPVAFSKNAAKQIVKAVRWVEGRSVDATSSPYSRGVAPSYIWPATVTTAIPTGTLAAPSTSGRVTIYRDNASGGLTAAETGMECHNFHTLSASIATGKTVSVYWRAGFWWLVAVDC